MGLVYTSRNHSKVQLMISRILRYAKTQKELNQPVTIFVTKILQNRIILTILRISLNEMVLLLDFQKDIRVGGASDVR